jgi:hypothetical protein
VISFRKAWPDERERAARICPSGLPGTRCFVAVDDEPVERLIGVAFWNGSEGSADGIVSFDWQMQPAYAASEIEVTFLRMLIGEVSESFPGTTLKTRLLLSSDAPSVVALKAAGFREHSTSLIFEGSPTSVAGYHERMQRTFGKIDRSSLDVISPNVSHGDALKRLVVEKERLLSAVDLDLALKNPDEPGVAFNVEWSSVVIERATGRLVGAHLVQVQGDVMKVPAVAIDDSDSTIPGLGWFLLFGRWLELCRQQGWTRNFYCRINPAANPTMLKLGGIFGYRQVGITHSYAIEVGTPSSGG